MIPGIEAPEFGDSYFGEADEEGIVVDGTPPRAEPIRILSYQEIVNEVVDDRSIAVRWCPIYRSGAVWDRIVDGRPLTFGVAGKLADDPLVMSDRGTESGWKQPTGRGIVDPLMDAERTELAARSMTFARVRADDTAGVVLQPVTSRDGLPGHGSEMSRYEAYKDRDAFGNSGMRGRGPRRSWERTDLEAKTVVLGIDVAGEAMTSPRAVVERAGGVVTDTVGGQELVGFTALAGMYAFEHRGCISTRKPT